MAIDEWQIQPNPVRALKQKVAAFRDGTDTSMRGLAIRIDALQKNVIELTEAINELVSMIKTEIKKPPVRKREIPPPPPPPLY